MKQKILFITFIASCMMFMKCAGNDELTINSWSIKYNTESNTINFLKNDILIYADIYVTYKLSDTLLSSKTYTHIKR